MHIDSSDPSPRKPGVGGLQNFVSVNTPYSDKTRSSREAIKVELDGKLSFDDPSVFKRLGVDQLSATFVDTCVASFQQNAGVQDARTKLDQLVANSSQKSEAELEAEGDDEVVTTKSKTKPSKVREKQMYNPLRTIFNFIETFKSDSEETRKFNRQWIPTGATTLVNEADAWSFPKISPDFTLLENNPTPCQPQNDALRLWRHRIAFAEIKPTLGQGPVPSTEGTVKAIVTQAADYARLHISARPFQLFSIGLLIFGTSFSVAIFDRGGVQFSPVHDIWSPEFIRVVRCLTCDMSPVELGQDPTVRILPDSEATPYQQIALSLGLQPVGIQFPTYTITMGKGNRCWYTLGLPIWSSLSLLGRGTVVWRVCDSANPSKLLVLKNAWRSSERLPESTIYQSIVGKHPGIADYEFGDDVVFPGHDDRLICVENLRGKNWGSGGNATTTPVLHRLLVSTYGRPLWDFKSELELLKGVRAALKGHQFLYEQGILHRDISAGNVLLASEKCPPEGHEGFVMDIEFAHHARSSLCTEVETVTTIGPIRGRGGVMTEPMQRIHMKFGTVSVKRGAVMTGTVQFMALDILEAIANKKPIRHLLCHDIESFIWVLCYSVGRRFVSNPPADFTKTRQDNLREFFNDRFGRLKLSMISLARGNTGPLSITEKFPELFSEPMAELFNALNEKISQDFFAKRRNATTLTYEILFQLFDTAIEHLQNSSSA